MSEYIVSYETLQHLPFAINLMGKEVVRCRDCSLFYIGAEYEAGGCCVWLDIERSPDDFCSRGIRRQS